jgi:hypothetical protein
MQVHAAARAKLEGLQARSLDVAATITRAESARERLDSIGGGLTVPAAEVLHQTECDNVRLVEEQIEKLEGKLADARQASREVSAKRDAAKSTLDAARREAALHEELHAAIEAASGVEAPSEESILAARDEAIRAAERVESSKQAITVGATIRSAVAAQAASGEHMAKAKRLAAEARQLRDAATDTANVLTQAIAELHDCPLKVKLSEDGDPRLVIATDRSDTEYFDELSDGEKWGVVVAIAAAANRLIVLPQSAFGELAPSMRTQLHELARANSCYILTAVADDCELHGAPYAPVEVAAE